MNNTKILKDHKKEGEVRPEYRVGQSFFEIYVTHSVFENTSASFTSHTLV